MLTAVIGDNSAGRATGPGQGGCEGVVLQQKAEGEENDAPQHGWRIQSFDWGD